MGREWIEEWIAIKLIVAFNTYLERAIGHWSCHTEDDIAMVQLPVVQRDLSGLIHFTLGQLSCARDAAAISATVPEEIRAVWAYEYPHFSTILKLCLLTGQRRSEIAAIDPEWLKDDILSLPPEITKNGRRHSIPLQSEAVKLLVDAPFGQNGNPWNGWSNGMKRFWKHVDLPHFVIHDLRRTFSTIHAEIGTPIHITERLLNHASGSSTAGVAGIYNRYTYMDEMRQCQEKYRDCLVNIVNS
jgi:hypothetical protein